MTNEDKYSGYKTYFYTERNQFCKKMEFRFLIDNKYRVIRHIFFWVAVLVFYTFFFGHQRKNYNEKIGSGPGDDH
ncbi:MAG: hypothetical protein K8R53_04875 [Bacteroidales bacterium]|nr:hypothetical protein [Bacteroidales bacterium]